MSRTVFILVPSPHPTGPVKGAFALANALIRSRRVVMVYLKDGPGTDSSLDARVEEVSLAKISGGWRRRLHAYRKLLQDEGGRDRVGSISMCLSADLLNRFCAEQAVICASVRGNLPQNYRHDFGIFGILFAMAHLWALHPFDYVTAMTKAMSRQIKSITGIHPITIGNFVDEEPLEQYRQPLQLNGTRLRFVFVGSLTSRKQPTLLVRAMAILIAQGHEIQLDLIGDGPLKNEIDLFVTDNGLNQCVYLHGQLATPYPLIANADAFILPSHSEGVSRAALESLYLGVPCVLRDVDGNAEVLATPEAGVLFVKDDELPAAMLKAALLTRSRPMKRNLLSPEFRQAFCAGQYQDLLEQTV